MAVQTVYYGAIPAMIDEVGAHDMGAEWFSAYNFKFCVMPTGDNEHETEYFETEEEAKEEAHYLGLVYGAIVCRIV